MEDWKNLLIQAEMMNKYNALNQLVSTETSDFTNTAEVAASIAIGGKIGGKIPTGKVSVPKVGAVGKIRNAIDNFGTPALAGANGMVISGAVPIEASISSATVASASGVVAGAVVGQNVVYSSKFLNQISNGGASKGNLSGGGTSYKSRNKPVQSGEPNSVNVQRDANGNVTKYTEFGDKGEFIKEVRLTGKEHGGIPRPNVKEQNFNINPNTGERFQNGYTVRPATSAEITKIK